MRLRSLSVLLLLAVAASCKDAAPPVPASVDAVTGPDANIVVATTLATAPTFEVRTASGKAIKNVAVAIVVTAGGGSLTGAPIKTVAGPTPIGSWTLGTGTGAQSVTVTVTGLPPLVFSTTATAGAAVVLEMVEGDDQRTAEGTAIPLPIRVRVEDVHGNGVPAVTVNWAVTAGDGDVAAASSLSDATGVATAPAWTVGLEGSGEQLLVASLGVLSVEFSAVVQEPAAEITVETTPPATVAAGSTVGAAPTFTVRDAEGNALNGVPVTVTVTAGGGSITGAPEASGPGATAIGAWTVGTGLGTQTVTVAAGGVPSAFISTTTVAGPPSVMVVLEGGGQEALAGTTVASAIRVRVEDAFTNVISGGTVSWTVIEGSGEVAAATSPANGSGEATAPAWTLGRTFGTQALRAQQDGAVADISAEVQSDYVLNVVYEGTPPNASVQQAFTNAVNRIKGIIVAEMSQVQFPANFNATACVAGLTINGELIPGLRIYATVEAIDGPGGVLGSAGPCYTRASNSLTVVGRMRFDSADLDNLLANGTLEAVILHEMLHVIGIGTLWEAKALTLGTAPGSTPLFTGPLATAACQNDHDGAIFCSSGVPREDCLNLSQSCGGGTINSHWKESVFRTELMTGYLNAGLNPFSKMTIQSLADLGYGVHLVPLDAYVIPPPALMSPFPAWSLRMGEPSGPIAAVDANGNITHVYPRRLDDQ